MPRDDVRTSPAPYKGSALIDSLIHCLPADIRDSLSERQLKAFYDAAARIQWGEHPVNLRLSIPLIFRRFYMVLIAGPERRSRERLARERQRHPIWRPGNVAFLAGVSLVSLYGASMIWGLVFAVYFSSGTAQ